MDFTMVHFVQRLAQGNKKTRRLYIENDMIDILINYEMSLNPRNSSIFSETKYWKHKKTFYN